MHRTDDGWRVDMQRTPRKTAREAARDAWGPEAANAIPQLRVGSNWVPRVTLGGSWG
jgi:hypothetical protein